MPCVLAGYFGGAQADDAPRSQLQEEIRSQRGLGAGTLTRLLSDYFRYAEVERHSR